MLPSYTNLDIDDPDNNRLPQNVMKDIKIHFK